MLILDEPTAVLTPQEAESLFATLQAAGGRGPVAHLHQPQAAEVLRVSDRIAVLRAGRLVATLSRRGRPDKASSSPLLMVGHEVPTPAARPHAPGARSALVRDVVVRGALLDVSLTVHAGEIAAIAGVSGNGQQVLADVLCGMRDVGRRRRHASRARRAAGDPAPGSPPGVARIPEDRHAVGVIGDLPLWENAIAEHYRTRFARAGLVRRGAARAFARSVVDALRRARRRRHRHADALAVRRQHAEADPRPRVAGAAATSRMPREAPTLIVASQPTWGLDIGAVAFVHQQLLDACAHGAAVLLISDDLDEIFALADRVAVMHAGRLSPRASGRGMEPRRDRPGDGGRAVAGAHRMRLEATRRGLARDAIAAPFAAVAFTLLVSSLFVAWAGAPLGQTYGADLRRRLRLALRVERDADARHAAHPHGPRGRGGLPRALLQHRRRRPAVRGRAGGGGGGRLARRRRLRAHPALLFPR